jgi:hypothetical protein
MPMFLIFSMAYIVLVGKIVYEIDFPSLVSLYLLIFYFTFENLLKFIKIFNILIKLVL